MTLPDARPVANDDTWVTIPVFNEATVLGQVVGELSGTFPNVVCVDDGSADGSSAQIASTGAHLVRHPVNLGSPGWPGSSASGAGPTSCSSCWSSRSCSG